MKLKTNVGQIFLTHPRDENYTTLYQETFSKHGQTVELFAVLEIEGKSTELVKSHKIEYERLTKILVSAFKKTYVTAPNLDADTFEKALAAINAALSRLTSQGKVTWYGRLNAAVAAVFQNQLALSITGNAMVYLVRKDEFTLLSEGLAELVKRPIRIFSNYSTGRLVARDRIILSTKQLFNYLSLDRLQAFLVEETLEETCQEAIAALQEIKNTGFATFIFEFGTGPATESKELPELSKISTLYPGQAPAASSIQEKSLALDVFRAIAFYIFSGLRFIWMLFVGAVNAIWGLIFTFFRKRPKKYLFTAISLVVILLAINLGFVIWQKINREKQIQNTSVLAEITQKLDEAEAAFLYDERRALVITSEIDQLLNKISKNQSNEEQKAAEGRLETLKAKINKEIRVDNPIILTSFPNIPTELLHSPNGFLGFNRNSNSLSFYDFRLGETKPILKSQNTSNLLLGKFFGTLGFVFLTTDGRFAKLNLLEESLTLTQASEGATSFDLSKSKIQSLAVFGEGALARLYALDTKSNQIWRLRNLEAGLGQPEPWLRTENASFDNAADLAVDGSIYILFPEHLEKYFNGQKQNLELAPVSPPLKNGEKIFTAADYQFLYILDPEHLRILVFTKQGKLQNQITSPKFHDLSDLYVDEKNKLIYILAGSELLQVNY